MPSYAELCELSDKLKALRSDGEQSLQVSFTALAPDHDCPDDGSIRVTIVDSLGAHTSSALRLPDAIALCRGKVAKAAQAHAEKKEKERAEKAGEQK